jgi:hypothetical protein
MGIWVFGVSGFGLIERQVDVVHNWRVELDGRAKNFVDLDGDVTRPVPVWVGDLSLQCTN